MSRPIISNESSLCRLNTARFKSNDSTVRACLPFELRINDIQMAMQDVYDFFYDVNSKTLHRGGLAKLRGSWIYKDLD